MPRVEICPGKPGTLIVKFEYHAGAVAAIKRVPGRQWNPEGKYWTVPDSPEARKVVGAIAAMPRDGAGQVIAVAPKNPHPGPSPVAQDRRQGRGRYVAGRAKPLTLNPPHPLIKQVDDELVLRGMAYGTRKSYGQHLRNFFGWLTDAKTVPERATTETVRGYLVYMAESGLASASYCNQARAAIQFLFAMVLKQSVKVGELPVMKRPEYLPQVLSVEEVARLFQVTANLKHRAILTPALA